MKELIKEAESLYLELSRITDSLIYARLHDDKDLLHGCRNELENFAQSVMQTLKCLVDRKDNIVDLSKIWKDGKKEKPLPYSDIVIRDCCITSNYDDVVDESQWAYLDDLLPKGGE